MLPPHRVFVDGSYRLVHTEAERLTQDPNAVVGNSAIHRGKRKVVLQTGPDTFEEVADPALDEVGAARVEPMKVKRHYKPARRFGEAAQLIAEGLALDEVAQRLGLSSGHIEQWFERQEFLDALDRVKKKAD